MALSNCDVRSFAWCCSKRIEFEYLLEKNSTRMNSTFLYFCKHVNLSERCLKVLIAVFVVKSKIVYSV